MGRRVNTYDYLAPSIKKNDKSQEMLKFMQSMDVALDEVADVTLLTAWDIEKADREELEIMAESLGLFPQKFMRDDVLRKYIRSSGRIRELKGTDGLIEHLVDVLTRFKVYEINLDETNKRVINVKLMYGTSKDFAYQERILDFLIEQYKKMIFQYGVTYVSISQVTWLNPLSSKTTVRSKYTSVWYNFTEYVFAKPFNLEPFAELNTAPFWDIQTKDVHRITSNTIHSGTMESTPLTKTKSTTSIILTPNVTNMSTVKNLITSLVEMYPDITSDEKVKMRDVTKNELEGVIYVGDTYKRPFELVTFY